MVAYAKREAQKQPRLTPQEYLECERKAETKSEYDNGVVVAMAGASWEHNLITGNLERRLGNQLEGKPCVVVSRDQRVRVPQCNKYYYPDVAVVCGEPLFEDAEVDTLLNPTLIVEVLSDSTEARDRGEKLECYQTLESLQTYVLVSQYKPYIEVYSRQGRDWLYSKAKEMTERVVLDAIGCELSLAEVYARIEFPHVQDKNENV
ncbi:MAG TPA: Uma2 family endonuclease [Chthonomonadaceae bacterium]|nr:Uma2 family endonuclease [Chthonomonadaceae bacterium]